MSNDNPTNSTTRARILDDIKVAMKAKDRDRLGTLRLVSAAIKQREVDDRQELDEDATIAVLEKMLKQRKESIAQYGAAGRDDLLAKEEAEAELIREYMPEAMPPEEIEALVKQSIDASGAGSVKDMGKVMAMLKPQIQGKADMSDVSATVKALLS